MSDQLTRVVVRASEAPSEQVAVQSRSIDEAFRLAAAAAKLLNDSGHLEINITMEQERPERRAE